MTLSQLPAGTRFAAREAITLQSSTYPLHHQEATHSSPAGGRAEEEESA